MRIALLLLGMLLAATPAMAQDQPTKKDPPKDAPKEGEKESPAKREMTAEAKKLFEDVQLVYAKYYAIVLEKTRANEAYKATEVWDIAVKEAKHTKYKDNKEWSDAVNAMKRKDKVFAKDLADFIAKKAEEHAKELQKAAEETGKK